MHGLSPSPSDLWRSQSVFKGTALLLLTSFLLTLFAFSQVSTFGTGTDLPLSSEWHPMDKSNMQALVKLYAQPNPYTFRLLHPKAIQLDNEDITKLGMADGAGFTQLNEEVAAMMKGSAPKKVKVVYMVRHGEGNHNSAEKKFGKEHWEKVEALKEKYLDVSLNEVGIGQCRRVQAAVNSGLDTGMAVDAIIVSPLSRALETAAIVMDKVWNDPTVPKVAVEMTRERYGKNQCDKRRSVTELKEKWPMVDFSHFMNDETDPWWTPVRESNQHVKERAQHFFQWLMDTEWQNVVLIGHSSFMSNTYELLSGGDNHWPSNGEVVPIVIEGTAQ